MRDFEEHLDGSATGLVTVSFAGGDQLHYQFGRTLRELGQPHILMRDSTQNYHALGVKGIGDRSAVISYLRGFRMPGQRLRLIGVSSGAYAALLYGQLVPADEVIVFSALSGRDVDDFDPKWHAVIGPSPPGVEDLRQHYRSGPIAKTISFISDGEATDCDRQMSERIGITDIRLIPGYAHKDLTRAMRDQGMLRDLLR